MKSDTVELAKAIMSETETGPNFKDIWETLSSVDCNRHTEKKGNLTYLSWSWAWGFLMEHYPGATFEFADNETHADGSMTVHCTVTIGECQRSMWLPVMDYKNSAIKSPNSRDISDNKMRCLTKALAVFGLAHYLYAGEDTINADSAEKPEKSTELITQKMYGTLEELIVKTETDKEKFCKHFNVRSISDLPKDDYPTALKDLQKKQQNQDHKKENAKK